MPADYDHPQRRAAARKPLIFPPLERQPLMLFSRVRRAGLGLLAVIIVACAADPAAAQTTLRYKFKKAEKLNYALEQKMTMSMNVMGMDVNVNMSQNMDMLWNILDVDADGKAKMTQTISRIRFTMDGGPTGKIEFDSKENKDPEGPVGKIMAPIFKALAGAEISLSMDSQGKISDVKVPDKITKATKSVPGGGGLGDMFSEEGIKQMIDQSGLIVPKEAVAKGKSWEQKFEMKSPLGVMKVDNAYTYEGPAKRDNKEVERVGMKPKLAIEPNKDSPAKITLKSQDAKGAALFDNDAGRLVETNMTQNLEMQISIGGMDIAQKLKQTMTMKLVDK
jgi:hypothetical protein